MGQDSDLSFEEFFAATYGRLMGLLFAFLHDRAQAEDVVQDALASALLRWPVLRRYHDPEAGCGWSPSAGPSTTAAAPPGSCGPCSGWGHRPLGLPVEPFSLDVDRSGRHVILAAAGKPNDQLPATVYVLTDGRLQRVPFAGACWQAGW